MSDEMTNLLSEIAPDLKDAPAPSETKTNGANTEVEVEDGVETEGAEDEGGDEGQEDIDFDNATPEQQKAWPKTFKNALSRAKKDKTRLAAEKKALEDRIAALERGQPQQPNKEQPKPEPKPGEKEVSAEMKAVMDKKPKLEDFKDWGSYNEALMDWKLDLQKQVLKEEGAVARKQEKDAEAKALETSQNEQRIIKQAKEILTEFPAYLPLLEANQATLEAMPQHVVEAFAASENPAIAFIVLAENKGALEALSKMSPLRAAQYIGQAEYIGLQQVRAARAAKASDAGDTGADGADAGTKEGKRVSNAPAPINTPKGGTSGRKALEQMNADELAKSKELADVFK